MSAWTSMVVAREPLPLPDRFDDIGQYENFRSTTRRRRALARRSAEVSSWNREISCSLNWLYGREACPDFDAPSKVQADGLEHFANEVQRAGHPTCTAAAALRELCGSEPGYDLEPAKAATYRSGSIALPSDTRKCYADSKLTGSGGVMEWMAEAPSARVA